MVSLSTSNSGLLTGRNLELSRSAGSEVSRTEYSYEVSDNSKWVQRGGGESSQENGLKAATIVDRVLCMTLFGVVWPRITDDSF